MDLPTFLGVAGFIALFIGVIVINAKASGNAKRERGHHPISGPNDPHSPLYRSIRGIAQAHGSRRR
mgnify:CR=1 FL=1